MSAKLDARLTPRQRQIIQLAQAHQLPEDRLVTVRPDLEEAETTVNRWATDTYRQTAMRMDSAHNAESNVQVLITGLDAIAADLDRRASQHHTRPVATATAPARPAVDPARQAAVAGLVGQAMTAISDAHAAEEEYRRSLTFTESGRRILTATPEGREWLAAFNRGDKR